MASTYQPINLEFVSNDGQRRASKHIFSAKGRSSEIDSGAESPQLRRPEQTMRPATGQMMVWVPLDEPESMQEVLH